MNWKKRSIGERAWREIRDTERLRGERERKRKRENKERPKEREEMNREREILCILLVIQIYCHILN